MSGDGTMGVLVLFNVRLNICGDWLCMVTGVVVFTVVGLSFELGPVVSSMLSLLRCKFLLNLFVVRCLARRLLWLVVLVVVVVDVLSRPLMLHSSFLMPSGFCWLLVARSRAVDATACADAVVVATTVWMDSFRGRPRFLGASLGSFVFADSSTVGVTVIDVDRPTACSGFNCFFWLSLGV